MDAMNKYLDDNLFSVDERKLLLKELLPRAREFGNDHIKRINERIELHKKLQQDLFRIDELETTIKSLETIKGIISEEIVNQFELHSSPSSAVIQKKVLPTTAFPHPGIK